MPHEIIENLLSHVLKSSLIAHWVSIVLFALIIMALLWAAWRRKSYIIHCLTFVSLALFFAPFPADPKIRALPFLFSFLIALVWYAAQKSEEISKANTSWGWLSKGGAWGMLIVLALVFARTDPFGSPDIFENQKVIKTWAAFHDKLMRQPGSWKECNVFVFDYDKEQYNDDVPLVGEFYLGGQVVRRINDKLPVKKCRIRIQYDFAAGPVVSVERL